MRRLMAAYRILHVADVHLDMAFAGVDPRIGDKRRRQLCDAFERALALAKARQADAVAIAGDLYEDGRAGPDRAEYLKRVLGELAPIRVFIAPGNHDPCTPSSVYRQMSPLPNNVTIFGRRRFAPATLADGIILWGFGHEKAIDRDPAIGSFAVEGHGTHLLLFHGSDRDRMPPGKEAVAPFSDAEIAKTGASHAMVGHFHGQLAGPHYAYPGSLEPHTFGKIGRHTASIVTVEDGRTSVEFVDVNRVRYEDIEFDVSPFGDRAALAAALGERIASVVDDPGTAVCRARLVGVAQRTLDVDAASLQRELEERYEGLVVVDAFAAFDLQAIADEGRTVRAGFVRHMQDRIERADEAERATLERALRYGLLAFAGKNLPT
jgi:DNA repair protein SbcD/Mre11